MKQPTLQAIWAVQDRSVPDGHLAEVVQDDHLGREVLDNRSWLVLGVRGDLPSLDTSFLAHLSQHKHFSLRH